MWAFVKLFLDPDSAAKIITLNSEEEKQNYFQENFNGATARWLMQTSKMDPKLFPDGYPPGTDFSLFPETKWTGSPVRQSHKGTCSTIHVAEEKDA